MADLFEEYRLGPGWDEMFAELGVPRESYEALHATLQPLSSAELGVRAEVLARAFLDQGITFALKGVERPFPLDIVPRIIAAQEWRSVEVGVAQRIRALEAFLADVYGAGQVLADGVVPRRIIATSAHFLRAAAGINPPNGVRVHVAGVDLIRDEQGTFRVLEDNVRIPSGVSYVMENRRAMAQVLPEVFAASRILPVESYPAMLLRALRAAAPTGVNDPTVVVLSPGVFNSAYFEHTLIAREMGVELVEGRDLICVGNGVAMRTTAGEQRVDVIYRRIDDDFLDPVHFRADSMIGVAGLLNAARAGRVTIANAVGNGVADDKLLYTYVPDLIRYYLNEEPLLPNVDTYRLDEPGVLEHVLDHLNELVLKPVDGAGGAGIVIGSAAMNHELDAVREKIVANPRGWIAQREVKLSMVPTLIGDRLRGRHVDLRPFAVNDGEKIWVLPGGLTRVALPEGELVVNSSQGGGSKDTWVLASPDDTIPFEVPHLPADPAPLKAAGRPEPGPAGAADAAEQQQQQQ
ncbi:putative circularly permuted ATP-grasp superfamily protein [Actinoplanes lutulentus]|uniref:Putative circularly permuted ATP-grasp superfamily protein n=1 Tax=Actinoplanes lutulentus TaxID=1287878 RepID=A0A327Z6A9_9ACTN|nr:circularly permuted type 2 ATP-grasp protein [Actinoplanes lutulentus]MBB2946036.1 putative circularly permuted ATP-grasp superfamily protein [Actinoplanes lutulentus]RAK32727.1 putative circularly permuted ATP-grasp superfamily protein [Actinoplanes lutulentus]